MKAPLFPNSINLLLYSSTFLVTQITGLFLSISICFILHDFTWGFVRIALVNSFLLGLALTGSCVFTQRFMFKMKNLFLNAISFSLVFGISIISFFLVLLLEPTTFIYYNRGVIAFLFINFLFIIAFHIICSGLIIYREITVEKEKTIGNERFLKNQMEMKLLSSRINPHFLFNTLNMILNLLKQPAKAEIALLNLSDLLRENLEQSEKSSIPVQEEIESVKKYLEIQKLRFEEKLHYEIKGDVNFPIPPLIIQPLVENSIKHNIQKVSSLTVEIMVYSNSGRNGILISDSEMCVKLSMLNSGQGLTITKRRVENNKGTFTIRDGRIEITFDL